MNETYKKLKEDGVVLTKDFFNEDDISKVRKEYDQLDASLVNKEIYKEKPMYYVLKYAAHREKLESSQFVTV